MIFFEQRARPPKVARTIKTAPAVRLKTDKLELLLDNILTVSPTVALPPYTKTEGLKLQALSEVTKSAGYKAL